MQVAVLSPHRDDAAFSCGITLQRLLRAGNNLTIVNVCTVSQYAPYSTALSGDRTQQITALRGDEDAGFVDKLRHSAGNDSGRVELIDLAWQDVPLRWCMDDHLALAPLGLRLGEIQELSQALQALPRFDIVLVPMALGGHMDHRLVLQAAAQSFPASAIAFYEDLPYACRMSPSEQRPHAFQMDPAFSEAWLPLHGSPRGSKQEYCLCYPSQIAVEVAEEIERYSQKHGGKERFFAHTGAISMLQAALRHEGAVID